MWIFPLTYFRVSFAFSKVISSFADVLWEIIVTGSIYTFLDILDMQIY